MNLTRRQFNALAIATAAVPVGSAFAQRAQFATPLPVPELIDTAKAGAAANLAVQKTRHAFVLGRPTAAYGVSASYLGPTIRIPASGDTQMNVRNALGRPTTLHWHGLLVPGNVDGGPQNVIANGALWRPVLPVKQPACSAWYHAHPHGNTAHQVYGGIAGMLILADGKDGERGLPHDYGIDDLPLVIQDRSFASDGALLYDASMPTTMFGYYGETVIVNGAIDPLARPPAKLVRLRLLNGANASTYRLGFSDGRTFHVCASDGGYLDAPIAVRDLLISPGERYEILVDFSDGRAVEFVTLPYQPAVRGGMGMMMRGIG